MSRWHWWLAAAVAVVHVVLALRAGGPVALPDVVAYLSVATWAAGEGPLVISPVYAPGFGLLLAPAAWLTSSAATLHAVALVVNGIVHALVVVVAVELARCLAPSRRGVAGVRPMCWMCALMGAFAATFPALVSASTIAWAEPTLALILCAIALCVARAAGAGGASCQRRWLLVAGVLAGVAPVFHPRLVVLLGALAVSVAASRALQRWWRWAVTGAVLGVVLAVGAYVLTGLWPTARTVEAAGSVNSEWLGVAAGQMIALAAATFGVGLVGLFASLWLRRDSSTWSVATFLSTGATGVVLIGGLALAGSDRADVFAYGRYVAPWAVPLVAVGLAALAELASGRRDAERSLIGRPFVERRRRRPSTLVAAAVGFGGVMVGVALVFAPDAALRPALGVMTLSTGALWMVAGSANVDGVVVAAAVLVGVSLTLVFFATGWRAAPTKARRLGRASETGATREAHGGSADRLLRAGSAVLAITLAAVLTVLTLVRNYDELGEAAEVAAAEMSAARHVRDHLAQLDVAHASASSDELPGHLCVAHDRSGIGGDVAAYVTWLYRFELSEFEHRFVDISAGEQTCSAVVIAGKAFARVCDATQLMPGGYAFLISSPPSTGSTAPVMYWLAGRQKFSVPCATSSGSA